MKSACISALLRMLTASAALLSASDSSAQAPAAQADVQRIVVVMDDAYPPYTFRDAEGDLVGVLPDQWRLWEASTGVSVELVATNWAAAQAFMKAGRADVIDTIFKTPERMRLYDFGPPYATLEVPVFAHKDLGGIVDAQSLRGFKIGVKAGDAVIERLAADGITGVVEYDGYESLVLAAKHGDVKVFSVDAPPAFYFMTRHGVVQDFNKMFVLYTGNFHRAFAKGDARIMELVQGGFDRLTPREYRKIERKWLGAPFALAPIFRKWKYALFAIAAIVLILAACTIALGILVRARTAKLAESIDRYNALARQNGIVTWEVDLDGVYTYLSALTEDTAGYSPANLVGKAHFYELHPETGRQAFKEKFLRSIREGYGFRDVIHPLTAVNGDTVWFQSFSIPLRHPDGTLRGAWGTSTDVTQRMRTEEARKESERNYRTLAETMKDIVWILDADSLAFLYISPSVEHPLGCKSEVFLGRPIREYIRQTDAARVEKFFRGLVEDFHNRRTSLGEFFTLEIPLLQKDGASLPTETVVRLWLDKETQRLEIHGSARDITLRKQIEDDLRESRRQHAALLAHLPGMAYRCSNNRQWSMAFVSSGCFELTGYTPEELIGDKTAAFNDLIRPDCREPVWERWQQALASHKRFIGEYEITTKSGAVRWVLEKGEGIYDEHGQVVALEGFITDITERKLAEAERERLLWTIEQSSDAIIITDPDSTIRYVNPAFERITGYPSREAVGQKTSFLSSGRQEPAYYEAMWTRLHQGLTWEGRMENKRKDGTFYTEQASITPARAPNGSLLGYIAIKRDITREIEAEKEKNALQNQLAQSQRLESIGLLAGGVAHDFNNMLQAILGYAEMALAAAKDDESVLRDDIAEIRKVALRSTLLTRQLLTFARRQPVEPQAMTPNRNLQNMAGMLDRLLGDNIRLKLDTSRDVGVVMIDPGQFEQIVLNLCINARDAIEGAGEVRIATETVDIDDANTAQFDGVGPGSYVRLSVADSGRGIPDELQSRIFEPFFSTKPFGKATGLGLPVVYGIVTQASGAIRLHSAPGKGTEFHIYLPRVGSVEVPIPADAGTQAATPSPGVRIMLVDDEALILRPTHKLLESLGHSVVPSNSPLEAIRLFKEHHEEIDLLISDVAMPDMSGPRLLAKLREIKPDLKCIFMSGHSADHLHQGDLRGLNAGFIQKPFTKADLAEAIATMLKT